MYGKEIGELISDMWIYNIIFRFLMDICLENGWVRIVGLEFFILKGEF